MRSIKLTSQRIVYMVAAFVLGAVTILPAVASAAQVTQRSIALSSSSVNAEGVTYQVAFTADGAAGAFVVDFCGNSPLIGQTCDAPTGTGFTAAAAATTTTDYTINSATATRVVVASTIAADELVSVDISGINNPDTSGPLYARIATYIDATAAAASTPQDQTGSIDNGGVAISITDTIGVSGVVLETMTFCVSETGPIADNCAGTTAPDVILGEDTGGIVALTATALSEDSMYTQISTNAANGAVVRLKSSAIDCGGLLRAGAPTACDIGPAAADISIGEAEFGVKTATATGGTGATGSLVPATGSPYNDSTFAINYVDGNATGVTSTFGDPFLETSGAPVNAQNMEITFGASISNNTPAGSYSTDMSMIAVGKF